MLVFDVVALARNGSLNTLNFFTMTFKDNQPIYMQITELACERVLLGQWPAEGRIPSVRELGVELQVNPNTVMRAYEFLEQQNIISNRRGVGFFVTPEAASRVLGLRREQFLLEVLPNVFRQLRLLEIPIEEVQRRYETFLLNN